LARALNTHLVTNLVAANRRGMIAMVGAVACFTTTDVLMKSATQTLPVSQVLATRGLIAVSIILTLLSVNGGMRHFRALAQKRVLQRTLFETCMILSYVTALSMAPFANVFSVLQAAPIIITAIAAFRGESVGPSRWAAVFAGFAGVALIVRPSLDGVDIAMGLALLAAFLVAARDLTTRTIPASVPSPMVTLATTLGSTGAGLALAPFEHWRAPDVATWGFLLGAAVTVALGNYAIIQAYRQAEASVVSPLRYIGVPVAIFFGFIVWGHVPDALALVGIALIVGSGLYTMRRETFCKP
jgi:drug/metabolite transporter (DMT)-like permease